MQAEKRHLVSLYSRSKQVITEYSEKRLGWKMKSCSEFAEEMSLSGYYKIKWKKWFRKPHMMLGHVTLHKFTSKNRLSAEQRAMTLIEPKVTGFLKNS